MRRCRYLVRKHHFTELAVDNQMLALHYLQNDLAQTVDHRDAEETKEVRCLTPPTKSLAANRNQYRDQTESRVPCRNVHTGPN